MGGDLFGLIKLRGKIFELNGSGRAAKAATIDFYEKNGYSRIPTRGPLAALTVPGIVHAWGELLRYASMELKYLLAPAISYAENGVPVNAKYAASIRESEKLLGAFEGWRKLFMTEGEIPRPGYLLRQKDLANSLRMISEQGTKTFYKGELADKIVKGAREQGGLFCSEDLQLHESTWKNPICTQYRGTRVYETSPNSQAATVLLWLNMLETFNIEKYSTDEDKYQEILIRAYLKANQERSKRIADPEFSPLPKEFTSKECAKHLLSSDLLRSKVESSHAIGNDTTYFAVADSEGNALSVIQSNFSGFGSGLVPRGTGIVLHNRGSYFSLDLSHHNAPSPGKRTFHTLCTSLGERDGQTLFAIGSMGGDVQPQVHGQLHDKDSRFWH
ncbi:MAG: gamma-glutamyltransferase family protein [Nitrososphaerales archaeon]